MSNKVSFPIVIGIDFDGTLVTHEYPNIGKDIGAVPIVKKLIDKGHNIMLWTMRGNKPTDDGNTLQEAVDWCTDNGILLWGINENPNQKESGWSNSNKQFAQIYIDDAALGCPLIYPKDGSRPYVDWKEIEISLIIKGIL